MPGTERLLYRSERIATEREELPLVNVVGRRTPHFASRRGTFSRIEFTIELVRVIETWKLLLLPRLSANWRRRAVSYREGIMALLLSAKWSVSRYYVLWIHNENIWNIYWHVRCSPCDAEIKLTLDHYPCFRHFTDASFKSVAYWTTLFCAKKSVKILGCFFRLLTSWKNDYCMWNPFLINIF